MKMDYGGGHQHQFPFDRNGQYYASLRGQQATSNPTAFDVVQGLYAQPDLSVSTNSNNQLFPSILSTESVNNMHATLGFEPFDVFSSNMPVKQNNQQQQLNNDNNLNFELSIPGISLTPLTALQVVEKVKNASSEVITRFLPCVDFLVTCQQELRAGLAFAIKKKQVGRGSYRDNLTPLQFYVKYLDSLPVRFAKKNAHVMPHQHLPLAIDEVRKLCTESKRNINFGCESVKNTFLGGMRDGESWGLRRWLSKNGGALHICSDLEHIFQALQGMDNEADTTRRLAAAIRPIASQVYERLTADVPSAYQEVSSAHPYLPFFHRLESALKSLGNFDPDDDDVVIIDDEEEIQACKNKSNKNFKREITEVLDCEDNATLDHKRSKTVDQHHQNISNDNNNNMIGKNEGNSNHSSYQVANTTDPLHFINECHQQDESDDCEVICVTNGTLNERSPPQAYHNGLSSSTCQQQQQPLTHDNTTIAQQQPCQNSNNVKNDNNSSSSGWRCTQCTFLNAANTTKCVMCESDEDANDQIPVTTGVATSIDTAQQQNEAANIRAGDMLARVLDSLATEYEQGRGYRPDFMHHFQAEMFWNRPVNYAHVLRLLGTLLREASSAFLIEPFALSPSDDVAQSIVNPICFRDIVNALVGNNNANDANVRRGQLKVSLNWNMFYGRDFLEAIDLVILNGLVFYGRDKGTYVRTCIIKLRKSLWDDINSKVRDRSNLPTKRSERSGFVRKNKKTGR